MSTPVSRRDQVRSLVAEILATDGSVESVCAEHPDLLDAVGQKLAQVRRLNEQLRAWFPPASEQASAGSFPVEPVPGEIPQIDGYELESVLGRGGVGIVYKARHLKLNRHVALKMLLSGAFAAPSELKRFMREIDAEARLQHPHIVQVFDVGEVGGRPYFTMEFLAGGTLAEKLRGVPQSASYAADIVATLADAVEAAHRCGIVHRDLKPTNVLLTADGRPKIGDFGLAGRRDAETRLTFHGDRIGTPGYMAPEQALGHVDRIGPAADVYALGAILYELLTGRPPFHADSAVETQRQVVTEEPVPPRRLNAHVPRPLETVCLMCLRKEPARRYASAADLSTDLRRFLRDEPVRARPVGPLERLAYWARRHRGLAASLAVIAGLLTVMAAASLIAMFHFRNLGIEKGRLAEDNGRLALRYEAERQAAQDAQHREERLHQQSEDRGAALRRSLYSAEMNLGAQAAESPSGIGRVKDWLLPWKDSSSDLRGWEWFYLYGLCHRDLHTFPVAATGIWRTAVSPDGKRFATAGHDGSVSLYSLADRRLLARLTGHDRLVFSVAWSPDGARLASASWDGTVRIWDPIGGETERVLRGPQRPFAVDWNADGSLIAAGSEESLVWVWDAATGRVVHRLEGHTEGVLGVAWHPAENRIASSSKDQSVRVWDLDDPEHPLVFREHKNWVHMPVWHPGGTRIASTGNDLVCRIWDARDGREQLSLVGHRQGVTFASWSADGSQIATSSEDQTVRLWNAADGTERAVLRGHTGIVTSVEWCADGKQLLSGSSDGTAKLWDAATLGETPRLKVGDGIVNELVWAPGGRRLAVAGSHGPLLLFDTRERRPPMEFTGANGSRTVAWSPDGKRLAANDYTTVVRVWDAESGAVVHQLQAPARPVNSLAWSRRGGVLAAADDGGHIRLWSAAGEVVRTFGDPAFRCFGLAWSPDDRLLASAWNDGKVRVYEAASGRLLWEKRFHGYAVNAVAWSHDGRRIASAGGDFFIQICDAATGTELTKLRGHTLAVQKAVWLPGGDRLASVGSDGTLRVWNVDSGKLMLSLFDHAHPLTALAWSPDAMTIAVGDENGTVVLYDALPGYRASEIEPPSR